MNSQKQCRFIKTNYEKQLYILLKNKSSNFYPTGTGDFKQKITSIYLRKQSLVLKKIYDPPYLYMLVYIRQFSVGSLATYSRPEAEGQRLHIGGRVRYFSILRSLPVFENNDQDIYIIHFFKNVKRNNQSASRNANRAISREKNAEHFCFSWTYCATKQEFP